MNSKIALASALLVTMALVAPPVVGASQGRGQGQAKKAEKAETKHKADGAKPGEDDHDIFDRDGHVRVIHDYVHEGSLPPGLAKRQSLPPGLEKQLRERGELPPGLQKHWVGVPGNLVARMPPMPPYYHRYFAGYDLVVVDTRTNTIAYLIRDVLR
jgi:hypothetical protein